MGQVLMTGGGSGAGASDDCTATVNDIVKGKTAICNGSDDEVVEGTLELTGDATTGYVYSGKTFYSTDPHTKLVGTMPQSYGATLTPEANEQRFVGNKYLLSDIVVPGFAMPAASIIQWGTYVTIYNRTVIGTYEGFHVGAKWIYNHGNIPADNQSFTVLTGINSGSSLGTGGGSLIQVSFRRTYTGYNQIVIKGTLFGSRGADARAYLSVGNKTITFNSNGYTDTAIVIPIPDVGYHGYWPTTIYVPVPTAQAYIDEIYLE